MSHSTADTTVPTREVVQNIQIPGYRLNSQEDALFVIRHVLEYTQPMNDIFNMIIGQTTTCIGCEKESTVFENTLVLTLDVPSNARNMTELLDFNFSSHGSIIPEFRCNIETDDDGEPLLDEDGKVQGCGVFGNCRRHYNESQYSDYMILHLKIFKSRNGQYEKITPTLAIEETITRFVDFDLHAVVWHHNRDVECGHYTADIKIDEEWYNANDDFNSKGRTEQCFEDGDIAPYIVVYKKRNSQIVPIPETATSSNSANNEINVTVDSDLPETSSVHIAR
jgi:hypothetical protein